MNVQLLLVPYDTAHRTWRSGAGPEHLIEAGLPDYLQALGHHVAAVQVIEDDPAESPAEIRTALCIVSNPAPWRQPCAESPTWRVVLSP